MRARIDFCAGSMKPELLFAALALALTACHSAGPYGHAPRYAPLSEETTATAGAREYDSVMFARQPDDWRRSSSVLFGIVTSRAAGPGGASYLNLSVRKIEPRNLCDNMNDEDNCRVTVSDADSGVVHAIVKLAGEDDVGEHSVGAGSLVRLVGRFGEDVDPNDGAPVLRATWYRHWPRYFYVTRAAARVMRQ